uniref:Uncharacterized protein n=1 Tax=Porphyridium purpureum TaxID=35688 RepID=W0RZB5_PORPP|nr:hypothetical protein Y721_p073 [Porphyridium purpureum]BAO23735.1 hypothetical protein [Porphyridium purpureum]
MDFENGVFQDNFDITAYVFQYARVLTIQEILKVS